jgi:hypothetical protein
MEEISTRWGIVGSVINTYLMPALKQAWKPMTFQSLCMPARKNIMSKPADAGVMRYVAFGYLINRDRLKEHINAYFDPLSKVVCESILQPHNHPISFAVPRDSIPFIQESNVLYGQLRYAGTFQPCSSLDGGLIRLILDYGDYVDDMYNDRVQLRDEYRKVAEFIEANRGGRAPLKCLGVFVSVAFAFHWMHAANKTRVGAYDRPCLTYVKTMLEYLLENPDFHALTTVNMQYNNDKTSVLGRLPLTGIIKKKTMKKRARQVEDFIASEKRHCLSLL